MRKVWSTRDQKKRPAYAVLQYVVANQTDLLRLSLVLDQNFNLISQSENKYLSKTEDNNWTLVVTSKIYAN